MFRDKRFIAVIIAAFVIGGGYAVFYGDPLGTERAQAEYSQDIEMLEVDLNGRQWIAYEIRTGEGYWNACVKSGLFHEITDFRKDVIEDILGSHPKNSEVDVTSLHPGDVVWVPVGKDRLAHK